jgi:hypothetical protein
VGTDMKNLDRVPVNLGRVPVNSVTGIKIQAFLVQVQEEQPVRSVSTKSSSLGEIQKGSSGWGLPQQSL